MNESRADKEVLDYFFGSYFHEDFGCEASNPDGVVTLYLSEADPREVQQLHTALSRCAERFDGDVEAEEKLYREYGCYYCPIADGLSVSEWLRHVMSLLRA